MDIWGTPQVDRDIHLIVDLGCRLCRWANYDADKATDANGMVSFSVKNKNTLNEVKNNKFVNSDTKAKEGGFIAFSIQPTTNALDESADYIWPQLVTDVNIKDSASTLTVAKRGGQDVNSAGNYVTTIDGQPVTNPPLNLDTLDVATTDVDEVILNISYMKNSLPIALYSPEIRVTADNGGKAAISDVLRPSTGLTSASSFSSPLVFNYTYTQKISLMCTKTGITTFKIFTGTAFKTHTMSCKNSVSDAKYIGYFKTNGIPGVPTHQYFQVTDRWGNPVSGVPVRITTSGEGTLTSSADVVTWVDGFVAADISSAAAGLQTVTATILDPENITQISSGTPAATSPVSWGEPDVNLVESSKKVTFTFYNLAGTKATIQEGKVKTYVKITKPYQVFVKKYTTGNHSLRISAGSVVWPIVATVP
jgi:hypothetical protein